MSNHKMMRNDSNSHNGVNTQAAAATALIAKSYYSGFALARDAYNSISYCSDGKIYYVLSSNSLNKGG